MKKVIFLFIVLFVLITTPSFAKTSSPNSQPATKSSYTLPYPGMLPDHPLYKLKVLRDKIIPFFIDNPEAKINFYLELTDKGMAATEILVDKGKIKLAQETALKAEHNYTLLTFEVKKDKWNITKGKYEQLKQAALKHQEVIKNIIEKVSDNEKEVFKTVLYFSQKNLEEIRNTLLQE